MFSFFTTELSDAVPVYPLTEEAYQLWLAEQSEAWQSWACQMRYDGGVGKYCLFPNTEGQIAAVVVGIRDDQDFWSVAAVANQLPKGCYQLVGEFAAERLTHMALAWALQVYQYNAYCHRSESQAALYLPETIDREALYGQVASFYLVRDLINTPTEDMGPAELAEAVTQVGDECGAAVFQVIGDDLLNQNFPLIHAVGRGAASQPRLVELNWGEETHPKLTLVGKGVCYDSGGYSLKPSKSMSGMKKDMGGAAHALGLAYLIMQAKLPVRLRLLIPMVENMVSDRSYRPGDVFVARNGLSVEVGNTDAEGRLILADALAYAAEDDPELLLDFATLTGAARVAMGPDVTPVMATNQAICDAVLAAAREVQDPMCQMPLYEPYKRFIQSPIADVANLNTKAVGQAGAITAGLFLQHFVADCDWLHFDLYGWHDDSLPGRPMGPGIMAIRAVWQYFQQKYTA